MLYLNMLSKDVCNIYKSRILPGLVDRILHGRRYRGKIYRLSKKAKDILLPKWQTEEPDKSVLIKLLTGTPQELYDLNERLKGNLNLDDSKKKIK